MPKLTDFLAKRVSKTDNTKTFSKDQWKIVANFVAENKQNPQPKDLYYRVLGVDDKNLAAEEIKKLTRSAVNKVMCDWHPDKNIDRDKEKEYKERGDNFFLLIKDAYDTLTDSVKKHNYDTGMFAKAEAKQPKNTTLSEFRQAFQKIMAHFHELYSMGMTSAESNLFADMQDLNETSTDNDTIFILEIETKLKEATEAGGIRDSLTKILLSTLKEMKRIAKNGVRPSHYYTSSSSSSTSSTTPENTPELKAREIFRLYLMRLRPLEPKGMETELFRNIYGRIDISTDSMQLIESIETLLGFVQYSSIDATLKANIRFTLYAVGLLHCRNATLENHVTPILIDDFCDPILAKYAHAEGFIYYELGMELYFAYHDRETGKPKTRSLADALKHNDGYQLKTPTGAEVMSTRCARNGTPLHTAIKYFCTGANNVALRKILVSQFDKMDWNVADGDGVTIPELMVKGITKLDANMITQIRSKLNCQSPVPMSAWKAAAEKRTTHPYLITPELLAWLQPTTSRLLASYLDEKVKENMDLFMANELQVIAWTTPGYRSLFTEELSHGIATKTMSVSAQHVLSLFCYGTVARCQEEDMPALVFYAQVIATASEPVRKRIHDRFLSYVSNRELYAYCLSQELYDAVKHEFSIEEKKNLLASLRKHNLTVLVENILSVEPELEPKATAAPATNTSSNLFSSKKTPAQSPIKTLRMNMNELLSKCPSPTADVNLKVMSGEALTEKDFAIADATTLACAVLTLNGALVRTLIKDNIPLNELAIKAAILSEFDYMIALIMRYYQPDAKWEKAIAESLPLCQSATRHLVNTYLEGHKLCATVANTELAAAAHTNALRSSP